MINKWHYLTLPILLSLSFALSAETEQELNAKFKSAYYSYQQAVQQNDQAAQLKHSETAFLIGQKLYGEDNINTANLALIWGRELVKNEKSNSANSLLKNALQVFKKEYGKKAIEVAEIYMLLALSEPEAKLKTAIKHYEKAIEIAEHHEEALPLVSAQIKMDAGTSLLRLGSTKSKIILSAQELLAERLPSEDSRLMTANYWAGRYHLARKKYEKAIGFLEQNLPVFEANSGKSHPLELSTHAFLVEAYEKTKQSDKATKHCVAIGSMKPWQNDQKPVPLFRVEPVYPEEYIRKGKSGWVVMEFVINKSGTVTDAQVKDSDAGARFQNSALAAVEQWRYAPKFENGEPVPATLHVRFDFNPLTLKN